jgi:hypothetical protein
MEDRFFSWIANSPLGSRSGEEHGLTLLRTNSIVLTQLISPVLSCVTKKAA